MGSSNKYLLIILIILTLFTLSNTKSKRKRNRKPKKQKNCYEKFGIATDSSERQIKKAFRKLAMKFHRIKIRDKNMTQADIMSNLIQTVQERIILNLRVILKIFLVIFLAKEISLDLIICLDKMVVIKDLDLMSVANTVVLEKMSVSKMCTISNKKTQKKYTLH